MWNDDLETKFLREIHFIKPYQHVPGSSKGVESWKEVEEALTKNYSGIFQSLDRKKLQDKLRNILQKREVVVRELAVLKDRESKISTSICLLHN